MIPREILTGSASSPPQVIERVDTTDSIIPASLEHGQCIHSSGWTVLLIVL